MVGVLIGVSAAALVLALVAVFRAYRSNEKADEAIRFGRGIRDDVLRSGHDQFCVTRDLHDLAKELGYTYEKKPASGSWVKKVKK